MIHASRNPRFSTLMGAVAAILSMAALCVADAHHNLPGVDIGDLVCGPRCAAFVLSQFGVSTDLVELVHESQWPNIEAGCSLDDIARMLEKRGVRTRAIHVPDGATLRWQHPVVVHLQPRAASTLGHFVVWLPSSTSSVCDIWTGLPGVQSGASSEFWRQSSCAALLTNAEEISELEPCIERFQRSFYRIPAIGATFASAVIAIACIVRAVSRLLSPLLTRNLVRGMK